MQAHVIARGLDPVDLLVRRKNTRPPDFTNRRSAAAVRACVLHEAIRRLPRSPDGGVRDARAHAAGLRKAIAAEWLQQVIDGMHFKALSA